MDKYTQELFEFVEECRYSDEDLKKIEELIDKGANPNYCNPEDEDESIASRIMDSFGRKKKRVKALKLLINKGFDANAYEGDESLLYFAARENDTQFVNDLLQAGVRKDMHDAFRTSVKKDNIDLVKAFLDVGFDVNDHGKTGINTVKDSYLCQCCEAYRLNSDKKSDTYIPGLEMAKLLLENGAKPDGKGDSVIEPFSKAVTHNFTELVELLIEYGINPVENKNIMFNVYSTSIAKFLISKGCDINSRWSDGSTPLIRKIVQEDDKDFLKFLLETSDLYAVNNDNETAFHVACKWGDLKLVKFALEYYDLKKCNDIAPLVEKGYEDQKSNVKTYIKGILEKLDA